MQKKKLYELFHESEDVFASDLTKFKGINLKVCQYKIPLRMDA